MRLCPEPVHWGGLSGCTYTEGVSWGKFVSREEGGRFAEVHCDATIAWPLLVRAIWKRRGKAERGRGNEKDRALLPCSRPQPGHGQRPSARASFPSVPLLSPCVPCLLIPHSSLGCHPLGPQRADALLLPLPVEKTVSYGTGTARGPHAILEASLQLETFDEETLVDFNEGPRVHTLAPLSARGEIEPCLSRIRDEVRFLRDKFLLALGGEHTVTYGVLTGLVDDLAEVTVVQIDAHADLADELHGRRWSHGTVMRRLWEQGARWCRSAFAA